MNDHLIVAVGVSFAVNLSTWALVFIYAILVLRCPIYHPFFIYLAYHFLGFVARPYSIWSQGGSFLWVRIGFIPTVWDVVLITAISNIALISIFFGLLFVSGTSKKIEAMAPVDMQIQRPLYFYGAVILLSLAGFYATWISLAGAGLDQVLAYSTELDSAGGQKLVDVSGYQTALAEFLPITCIFLFFSRRTRRLSLLLIAAFVAVRVYAGAQRLSFIVVLAAVFLYFHVERGLRYPKFAPMAVIFAFALVFDVIGNDRYALRRIMEGTASLTEIVAQYVENRGGEFLTSDIVEYDVAAAASSFISVHGDYTYGTQYLRLLIWPIPRQIWAEKPVYTSIVDLNKYGDFRFLTTSLYADSFMVFSFVSLVPMMIALGMVMAWVYKKANRTNSVQLFMFFWVFLIYQKTILRDGGVTVVYFWIFSMIAVAVLCFSGRIRLCRTN